MANTEQDNAITPSAAALPTIHQDAVNTTTVQATPPPQVVLVAGGEVEIRLSQDTNVSPRTPAPATHHRPPTPEPTGTRMVRGWHFLGDGEWRRVDWRVARLSELWEKHEVPVFRVPDWDGKEALKKERRRRRRERWAKAVKKGTCRGEKDQKEAEEEEEEGQPQPATTEEAEWGGDGASSYAETTEVMDAFGDGRYEIGSDGLLHRKLNLPASIRRKLSSWVKAVRKRKKAAAAPAAATHPGPS